MAHTLIRALPRLAVVTVVALAISGCNMLTRLSEVGEAPELSAIENPTQSQNYRPVSMPMPMPEPAVRNANSLWRPGARAFFKDQRAHRVGDLLTITIEIDDDAELTNTSTRSRNNSDSMGMPAMFGYEGLLRELFPDGVSASELVSLSSALSNTGVGTVDREEEINLKVAAVVVQVLPNGNLVIHGRQEIRVNFEVRELQIGGIVRPEDITFANTISYEKIAEARIAYGGRGQLTDVQQPRYGQQVLDIVLPF